LSALKDATIELTVHSSHLVIHEPIRRLPTDVAFLMKNLPSRVFPSHVNNATSENDPTGVLEKVDQLLVAVKDLLFWSKEQKKEVKKQMSDDILKSQQLALEGQVKAQDIADQTREVAETVKQSTVNVVPEPVSNGIANAVKSVDEEEQQLMKDEINSVNDAKAKTEITNVNQNHNRHQKRSQPKHKHNQNQNHVQSQTQTTSQ